MLLITIKIWWFLIIGGVWWFFTIAKNGKKTANKIRIPNQDARLTFFRFVDKNATGRIEEMTEKNNTFHAKDSDGNEFFSAEDEFFGKNNKS